MRGETMDSLQYEEEQAARLRARPHSIGYAIIELHRIPGTNAGEDDQFKVEMVLRTREGYDWKAHDYTVSYGDVAVEISVGMVRHYVLDMLQRADAEAHERRKP